MLTNDSARQVANGAVVDEDANGRLVVTEGSATRVCRESHCAHLLSNMI